MLLRGENWLTARALWLALIALAQRLNEGQCICPSPYYPLTHTACLNASTYSTAPKGVGQTERATIVSEHNKYRATVQATDMQMMYWDDELAFVAQKWAENCASAYDTQRGILCKYSAGQNLAVGHPNWLSAIQSWYNDTYKFTYGSSAYNYGDIALYTQMMWNNTAKIGCGYSYCTNYEDALYVCNYAPSGNTYGRVQYPYTIGTKCSACPNRCSSSGLCDCGGLVCKNGGVLNINTCTCSCPSPYQGSADCNLNCTGVVDKSVCNKSAPSGFPPSYCSKYSNVPLDCPLMCGTCPGTMCTTLQSTSIAGTSTSAGSTKPASPTTVSSTKITTQSTTIVPATTVTTKTSTAPTTVVTTKPVTIITTTLQTTTNIATTKVAVTTTQVTATTAVVNRTGSNCPSPYYPTTHTACLNASRSSTTPKGVGTENKTTIVAEHNKYRASVQAKDMQMMYWDDELAFVAQKLAENCTFEHDPQRGILCKYSAGQNLALGSLNWASAIQGWYNETYRFTYGSSVFNFPDIGHYTQMMWNDTAKVGCGYSYCTNYGRALYVCNYAPSGNTYERIQYPYTIGAKCSACPNRCSSSGLCDCGGLVCKNGGVLNINTCTCSCPSPYQGSADCNLNCNGVVDKSSCNKSAPSGFPPSYCSIYSNVPLDCPLMCGTCPGTACITLQSTSIAGTLTTAGFTTTAAAPTTVTATKLTSQSNTTVPTTKVNTTTSPTTAALNTTKLTTLLTTNSQNTTRVATTTVAAKTTNVTAATTNVTAATTKVTAATTKVTAATTNVTAATTKVTAATTKVTAATTNVAAATTKVTAATTKVTAATTKVTATTAKANPNCPSPFYPADHAACLTPSPYSTAPKGINAADRTFIVAEHNRYRASVQAADMQMMYWDDELAYVAQKIAESCSMATSPPANIQCKYTAAPNLFFGYSGWATAIQSWYNGTYKFTYGSSANNYNVVGNYIQMMWNNSAKVGCGFSYCSNYQRNHHACVYSQAGNLVSRLFYPYIRGTKCSACPNRCSSSGLCDCGGLVCKNGGVLDVNTCTCSCPSSYRGSVDCNLNCTGVVDESYCNQEGPCGVFPSDCPYYGNECPWMCGTCPGSSCLALQSSSIAAAATTSSTATTKVTTPTVTTTKSMAQTFTTTKATTPLTTPPITSKTSTASVPAATTAKQTTPKV